MRLSGFLTDAQVQTVHANALRVLEEVGVCVDHEGVRARLRAVGGATGPDSRVRFSARTVEAALQAARKAPPHAGPPRIDVSAWVYQCDYLDPATGRQTPFDETLLARYLALARTLLPDATVGLLGVPYVPDGLPPRLLPLAEKAVAWRWGAAPGGGVHSTDLCAPLLDLFTCHARHAGRPVHEVFAAGGYLVSPLRLARPECEQLVWFHERGLRYFVGHLPMQGGTAPVTMAGAVVQALAEQVFLYLLQSAFWPDAAFSVGGSVSTVDMRSGVSCYGRPEMQRINAAFAALARFYGCGTGGHAGLTDAKRPGCEAGAQKAASALWTALACGAATVEAGMLSMDELCSPVQMVLDRDIALSLRALLAEPAVTDDLCALPDIAEVCRGGSYVGTEFTAAHHRAELWTPATWSREFVGAWAARGSRQDVDHARDAALAALAGPPPAPAIGDEEDAELRGIIAAAARTCA